MNLNISGFSQKINKFNRHDLIIFLIPLIIFSVYLYVFNPGIVMFDTCTQFHEIASNHYGNWHPFFHTFIEMLCLYVYPSPISVCVLQIFVFSIMWMVICKYNRKDDIKTNNSFLIQVVITSVICLIPMNALYSITLWKDVLFSYFLMFLCFLGQIMIDKKGAVDYKFIIVISMVMAFVSQLRPNGLYVVLIVMCIYSIYIFKKNNSSKSASFLLPILTITFILLISSLNIVYDVEDDQADAVYGKIAHMLADYDLNLELSDSDRNKIRELVPENLSKGKYNLSYIDPIRDNSNQEIYDANKLTYITIALNYSLKNPLHCLHYLFGSSVMVWDISRDQNWIGSPYYLKEDYDISAYAVESYYAKIGSDPIESYENVSFVNWGKPIFKMLNSFTINFKQNIVFDTLFDSPATYMYLAFIILLLIQMITKSKDIYLIYLPNFLNIIVIFASTPIQDSRYLYGNLLVCYLLIIIFVGLRQNSDDKSYYISAQDPHIRDDEKMVED